jgi:autophagy-related protein 27
MPSLLKRTAAPLLLLLSTSASAVTFDCSHIRTEGQSFDLSALGGPKTVHWQQSEPPSISNTTFTVDICNPIRKDSKIDKNEQCMTGTRICAVEEAFNLVEDTRTIVKVVPIAGDFYASHGRALDPEVSRLKDGASNSDSDKEGLLVQLHGGKYPETRQGVEQKAIVEFQCDKQWTGLEGFADSTERKLRRREADEDEDDGPELPDLDKDKALQFKSYKLEGSKDEVGTLRLTWKTRYACEGAIDEPSAKPEKSSGGWGFFTWSLIVLFLLAAAYIIFGSWLNYNRYGARGWDLIPHGDTIRDIPYLVKEWTGDLIERMKGGGSRGGYSAV